MCWLNLDCEDEGDCEHCVNKEYCEELSKLTKKDK